MVVLVPNIRPKGVLFPVGAGRSVRRAHVIQKVRPGPPRPPGGGNSPGTGLGTNTYTNDYISAQADCAQYIELLAP